MKKVILSILFLGGLFATSCTSDPCKDQSATTKCGGKGTLVANGSSCNCSCSAGFYGADCSVAQNGTYVANADLLNGNVKSAYNAQVTIQGGTASISGGFPYLWGNTTQILTGTFSNGVITISDVDPTGTGAKFSGSGSVALNSDNKMQITWSNTKFVQASTGSTLTITSTWLK